MIILPILSFLSVFALNCEEEIFLVFESYLVVLTGRGAIPGSVFGGMRCTGSNWGLFLGSQAFLLSFSGISER